MDGNSYIKLATISADNKINKLILFNNIYVEHDLENKNQIISEYIGTKEHRFTKDSGVKI